MAHIVALSGGKDSTAMALLLAETKPDIPFNYICTPTGDELPEMFDHWNNLSGLLGKRILPIGRNTFKGICEQEKALPNHHMRFCTRRLKIEPFIAFVTNVAPAVSYVGLRADEEGRQGINHGGSLKVAGTSVEQCYPLRDAGWGISDVYAYLEQRGVIVPERTDCARCFYQTLGEWWRLWKIHPGIYADAEEQEKEYGHTFRSPSRDTWPAALSELREEFERGNIPRGEPGQMDLFRQATCRVCTL